MSILVATGQARVSPGGKPGRALIYLCFIFREEHTIRNECYFRNNKPIPAQPPPNF